MTIVLNKKNERIWTLPPARPEVETVEDTARLELLRETAEEACDMPAVTALLEGILNVTRHTLTARSVLLFLDKKGSLPLSTGRSPDALPPDIARAVVEVAAWVAAYMTPLLISDLSRDIRFGKDIINSDASTSTVIAAPVIRGKAAIGAMVALNKRGGGMFDERELRLLRGFASADTLVLLASMASLAIENINRLSPARVNAGAGIPDKTVLAPQPSDRSRLVCEYALMTAEGLSLAPRETRAIEFGTLLCDIGTIGINRDILCKPEMLTEDEQAIIYEHSAKAASVIGEIPVLREAAEIVLYHHESYDGKGYPGKLSGDAIPIGARIVAVADAFADMTTGHSHRAAFSADAALTSLVDGIGTQFCPVAVEAFITAFNKHLRKDKSAATKNGRSKSEEGAPRTEPVKPESAITRTVQLDTLEMQGNVRLSIPVTPDARILRRFRSQLARTDGIKLLMMGSSEEEGHYIIVSLPGSMPLPRVLRDIPSVKSVEMADNGLVVDLFESTI